MINIRLIEVNDNARLKDIVQSVIEEFKGNPETTMAGDPALNTMYQNYQYPRSVYYVVELDSVIVGGCGIKQLDGTTGNICELQRMFLLKEARGKGIGKLLINLCIKEAKQFNYEMMYLETLNQMEGAIKLYLENGFKISKVPLGNTGHGGCNIFMVKDLNKLK